MSDVYFLKSQYNRSFKSIQFHSNRQRDSTWGTYTQIFTNVDIASEVHMYSMYQRKKWEKSLSTNVQEGQTVSKILK